MSGTKFYSFDKNHSDGSFGIGQNLTMMIVEANSEEEALLIAEGLGASFDYCETNTGCECCGDGFDMSECEVDLECGGLNFANIEEYSKYMTEKFGKLFSKNLPYCRIHFLDGTVKEFYS
jgi:hypothetical protein